MEYTTKKEKKLIGRIPRVVICSIKSNNLTVLENVSGSPRIRVFYAGKLFSLF